MSTLTSSHVKLPVVYDLYYNIGFFGIEKCLHSFDSKKYGRVFQHLANKYHFKQSQCHQPVEPISKEDLLLVHTKEYLASLSYSTTVAGITEIPFLIAFPNSLLQNIILHPMRLATAGTVLASELALRRGWAINLSGGYHHAKSDGGEGFCVFADIPLAIHKLMHLSEAHPTRRISKVLIIDLDAHQGNGYQTLFTIMTPDNTGKTKLTYKKNKNIGIFDMYNGEIYPGDKFAKQFITYDCPLKCGTNDAEYLQKLTELLPRAMTQTMPEIVFYNAGTDIYEDDPLGALRISADGIILRDEMVFRACKDLGVPIVMVLSGGYTSESANIIARSIDNLHEQGLINLQL
jgi:histone deacetylase 11